MKENTIKNYNYCLGRLPNYLLDKESVLLVINNLNTVGTKKNYFSAIKYKLGNLFPYQDELDKIFNELENNKNEKQEIIYWEKIISMKNKMTTNTAMEVKQKLLVSLYCDIEPRRILDYYDMIYVKNEITDKEHNYSSFNCCHLSDSIENC